ncbi:CDP-glycerol glycerophosphotransferase family protein [Microlunatus soli]|nr:CDP-glycerol glycerophosphotransferase family protein [Microlunatus soli]
MTRSPETVSQSSIGQQDRKAQPAPAPPDVTGWLLGAGWERPAADGSRRLRIDGAGWRTEGKGADSQVISVTLVSDDDTVELMVQPVKSAAYNDRSESTDKDRTGSGFVALLDPRLLTEREGPGIFFRKWQLQIAVEDRDGRVEGPLLQRDENTSAGHLHTADAGDGCLILPSWDDDQGLVLTVARRALTADSISFDGDDLDAVVTCRGDIEPRTALLRRGQEVVWLTLSALPDGRYRVRGSVRPLTRSSDSSDVESWYLVLADDRQQTRMVHWHGHRPHGYREASPGDPRVAIRYAPKGVVRVDVHRRRLVVDRITVEPAAQGPQLIIEGECHELSADPADWLLVGGRRRVQPVELQIRPGQVDHAVDRFSARYPLLSVPDWGRTPTALPSADYRLTEQRHGVPALLDQELAETLISSIDTEQNTLLIAGDHGKLVVRTRPPMPPGERSRYRHRRFEIRHRKGTGQPTDTIFLDCFDGKSTGDNIGPIADELARRRPDLRPVWTVADRSVEVPDGVDSVIFKTDAWWRALTWSRLVVTNCWMPGKFLRRDHQTVLQTWHGTPLKLLGFDRIGTKRGDAYRRRTTAEVSQWSMLISQNPYSSEVFRSAYGFEGTVLEIGYPRNDRLSRADDDDRRQIRDRLGIGADERVVLYAPTWRENAKGLFAELDFDAVAAALGPAGRLLIRGHANTIRYGGGVRGGRLLDVTLYPDLAELYLISDVMITDYSSTMFDFSVTGKPMIFFTPDIDAYTGTLRGTYFDLAADAPGPLVATTDEVIAALADLDRLRTDHAERYAQWRQRFNPYDDGRSGERAVDALLADQDAK